MQSEFVASSIILVQKRALTIEESVTPQMCYFMGKRPDTFQLIIPAVAYGIDLPGTDVETLSDLIFYLSA